MIQVLDSVQLPVVAGVRGYAAGVGNMLALSADVVVAAPTARFWVPFVTKGFTPDSGTTWLLPRLVGMSRAKEMVLRGKPITGERAAAWGLVSECVPEEDLDAAVASVTVELADAATVSLGLAKTLLHRNLEIGLTAALQNEAVYEELAVRTDDFKEGMRAFAEKREPSYTGRIASGHDGGEPNGRTGVTRAEEIARALEDEIVALGWPLGQVLGSEPELVDRFDTSRAILREAVRIIEQHGAGHMRRGPGGGLVVTAPSRASVANAAGVWLASEGVLIGELLVARHPLLLASIREAVEQIDADGDARLLGLLAELEAKARLAPFDFVSLDLAIAEIGRNPALELFLTALGEVLITRLNGTRAALEPPIDDGASAVHLRGYRRLIEAIVAGDAAQAEDRRLRLQRAVGDRAVDRAVRPRRGGAVIPETGGKLGSASPPRCATTSSARVAGGNRAGR